MKILLKDIVERFPEFQIRNYSDDAYFLGFNHDSREIVGGELYIPIRGEKFDGHDFILDALNSGANMSLCEKESASKISNTTKPLILVDSIEEGLQKIINYSISSITAPIVAISGSTGKTTTKQMLVTILSTSGRVLSSDHSNTVWGNAGLLGRYKDEKFIVLEFAMDKKGEIAWHCNSFDPDLGILLNVGYVHAEKLGSIDNIYEEKKNLADYLSRSGKPLILNIDDERLAKIQDDFKSELITFGSNENAQYKIYDVTVNRCGTDFNFGHSNSWHTVHINAFGHDLVYNALSAIIAANKLGVNMDDCIKGIANFEPNSGRFEIIDIGIDKVVVNDAYNANPQSMEMSLSTFNQLYEKGVCHRIAILGDMKELGDIAIEKHKWLGELVKDYQFEEVYYIGDMFEDFGFGEKIDSSDEMAALLNHRLSTLKDKKVAILLKGSNSLGLHRIPDYLKKLGY